MTMKIANEGWVFIIGLPLFFGVLAGGAYALNVSFLGHLLAALALILALFMVYFFRDPERAVPGDPNLVLSGADGVVRCVETLSDLKYLGKPAVRISVFLSPMDVHINRTPIAGTVQDLGYVAGKHLLTMNNAASEHNEHSRILIQGEKTTCLVHQIVGPIVRRVIYWLQIGQILKPGDRIGLMKFGSRLDVYLPAEEVEVLVQPGEKVQAGITTIARVTERLSS